MCILNSEALTGNSDISFAYTNIVPDIQENNNCMVAYCTHIPEMCVQVEEGANFYNIIYR